MFSFVFQILPKEMCQGYFSLGADSISKGGQKYFHEGQNCDKRAQISASLKFVLPLGHNRQEEEQNILSFYQEHWAGHASDCYSIAA